MEKSEIKKIIKLINSIYPKSSLKCDDTDTIEIWNEMLNDYSFNEVRNAIKEHAKSNQFIPTIAEIIQKLAPTFFKIEIDRLGNDYAVYVNFPESRYPFKFKEKDKANDLLRKLQSQKNLLDENSIREMHNTYLVSRGYTITTVKNIPIDQIKKNDKQSNFNWKIDQRS